MQKKTKIVCTLGPATSTEEMIKELCLSGMDIARLNFSHGNHEGHGEMIAKIKKVREELGLPIAILLDTKGPEIRTGLAENGREFTLEKGEQVIVTTEDVPCNSSIISVTYKNLPEDVVVGGSILIADGLIELKVKKVEDDEKVICEVVNGGELGSRKGVNLPNVKLKLPAITEQDRADIIFGINEGVDFIAASFIRNAEAIREIRGIIHDCNSDIAIIAKIENMEGMENLDEIIAETDGIMVARGDLGVEVEPETLPYIQKTMIQKCNAAFKPVITATQMLDSMIRNPRPTRAEVTDVANAIYDGTDAIMLSGETAAGKYPIEAVQMMAKIAKETETHYESITCNESEFVPGSEDVSCAISYSAVATAGRLDAKLIIASSFSGYTARLVSKYHPKCPIIGLSPLDRTLRKMQIYRGVQPLKVDEVNSTDHLLDEAVKTVSKHGYVNVGDVVILTAGVPAGKSSVTNMIKAVIID
ncbi:pyruvate kinase [Lachnoclostridium phytofermentans]|uniref:Pyruvate kinase n=1 Tax=Lachnoclostridium phytofermentans (strain ATCC 700394 / DSM 18823 / ISDg) TaxID=357809 RepID=A9KPI4_LACP7|nr:pyruvate kinase [Lachnoclostridium phytofermentans]ABX43258.1 pyruvate kinase [Lachnoclostridium phytofermentans ISDg]